MVKQQHDTQGFRASYRQGIKNFYSGWRHLSSIVALSTLIMLYCLYNIEVLEARDWLMVPLGMVIYNLGEYASHRWVGHIKRRWARLFYQRHTGEHHSFFSELLMSYDTKKDWRLVLFPLYLTAIQGLLIAPLLGVLVALLFSSNAAYLLVFLLCFGPTRYLLNSLVQNIGDYLTHAISLSMWTDANTQRDWQTQWTAFYWGWWIAWAPFVGMFIARISKGRTIREFIIGVLLVPTLLGFIWLTLFGNTALYLELFNQVVDASGNAISAVGEAGIIEAVNTDVSSALYATLTKLDAGMLGNISALVATLLIATYFITSSDSGTLVITTILSMGNENPPVSQRVIWGLGEGAVAAILLAAGGLKALQTAAITAALPFSFVMIIMSWGLIKALREEKQIPRDA